MLKSIDYVGHRLKKVNFGVFESLSQLMAQDEIEDESGKFNLFISDDLEVELESDYFVVGFKRHVSYIPNTMYDLKISMEVLFSFEPHIADQISSQYIKDNIQKIMQLNHNVLAELSVLVANVSGSMGGQICIYAPIVQSKENNLDVLPSRPRKDPRMTH